MMVVGFDVAQAYMASGEVDVGKVAEKREGKNESSEGSSTFASC